MKPFLLYLQRNRSLIITVAVLLFLLILAIQGMQTQDWVVTLLRSLSVAAVTFLVAAGFSLIFGLLDVLNLAHGTLFMIGAYVAWTVYVRPDTFVDVVPPLCLAASGFALLSRRPLEREESSGAPVALAGLTDLRGIAALFTACLSHYQLESGSIFSKPGNVFSVRR